MCSIYSKQYIIYPLDGMIGLDVPVWTLNYLNAGWTMETAALTFWCFSDVWGNFESMTLYITDLEYHIFV